jgi:hypothetical protein
MYNTSITKDDDDEEEDNDDAQHQYHHWRDTLVNALQIIMAVYR